MTHDPRIDAYIEKSADFAKPILNHLRALVHKACPDVQETMKWSFPHFEYKGILCSMASFKQHCTFGFWKGAIMKDAGKLLDAVGETAMGHFGRIISLKDLPPDKAILAYITEATELNERSVPLPSTRKDGRKTSKEVIVPDEILKALKKNEAAMKTFEAFPPSHKREYIEWITEAKTEPRREKRTAQMLEWLAEGKSRNWKYERK